MRQAEIDKIAKMLAGKANVNDVMVAKATHLVDSGIRSADGFEIENKYTGTYAGCGAIPSIKPKTWEDNDG